MVLLEKEILQIFCEKKITLSVAESCTGGLISYRLVSQAGASSYFLGGLIAYSNECKEDLLKVNPKTIEKFGSVSGPCAEEMARGALVSFDSDFAVATTGIAGPSGGTLDKPVGLVYFAIATRSKTFSWKEIFLGDRSSIIESASSHILEKLFLQLSDAL